jgi:hypothetical protein
MQNELLDIFRRLKTILKGYENPLEPKFELDSKYALWSMKTVVIDGRKKKEVYFAGLIIQSSYVGLYYMPIYSDTYLKSVFHPDLLKLLKGKSCFHIKKLDAELEKYIEDALEKGYELYRKRGWI